jgi:alpha-tubulin suppressor-like RCC1 family protein
LFDLNDDDDVWVFGMNYVGQLGLGDDDRSTPIRIPNLKAMFVSDGLFHTILIDLNDDVWVFGWNNYGQLGLGDQQDRYVPTQVPNLKAMFVSAGYYHTIVIGTQIV